MLYLFILKVCFIQKPFSLPYICHCSQIYSHNDHCNIINDDYNRQRRQFQFSEIINGDAITSQ